jgi:hypothetical protein
MSGAAGLVTIVLLVAPLLGIAYFIFWLFTLINCVQKCSAETRGNWILLIVFVPIFGAIAYWVKAPKNTPPPLPRR